MCNNKICDELNFWIEGHARESEHSDLKRSTTWCPGHMLPNLCLDSGSSLLNIITL